MTLFLFLFLPPRKKLRESDVCSRVCLSVHNSGGLHVTITQDGLELTIQGPSSSWPHPQTSDLTVQDPLLVTSGGQD